MASRLQRSPGTLTRRNSLWSEARCDGGIGKERVLSLLSKAITMDVLHMGRLTRRDREIAHVVSAMIDCVLVWYPNGELVEWNEGAENLYGYAKDEVIGKNCHEVLRTIPQTETKLDDLLEKLSRDRTWRGQLMQTTKCGSRVHVESRICLTGVNAPGLVIQSNRTLDCGQETNAITTRVDVDEQERRRFVATLHDEIGKVLNDSLLKETRQIRSLGTWP